MVSFRISTTAPRLVTVSRLPRRSRRACTGRCRGPSLPSGSIIRLSTGPGPAVGSSRPTVFSPTSLFSTFLSCRSLVFFFLFFFSVHDRHAVSLSLSFFLLAIRCIFLSFRPSRNGVLFTLFSCFALVLFLFLRSCPRYSVLSFLSSSLSLLCFPLYCPFFPLFPFSWFYLCICIACILRVTSTPITTPSSDLSPILSTVSLTPLIHPPVCESESSLHSRRDRRSRLLSARLSRGISLSGDSITGMASHPV